MDVLTPRSLDEALRLKAELPEARFVQGGTDVLVELNFDRSRPAALLNLNEVAELRGWRARTARSCSARRSPTRRRCARARRRCCPRSPRRRERSARRRSATAARSAATSAPPRPPATRCRRCSSSGATVRARERARRADAAAARVPGRREANRARGGRARHGVRVQPSGAPQTFMKVGPRNAMVIAVCSLAVVVDRERGEVRAAFGSAAPDRRAGDRAARRRPASLPGARRGGGAARSTTCAARPPTAATRSRVLAAARACEVHGVRLELTVNGERHETDAWGGESLLYVLRERLGLPGSKNACEQGECGSCSVLLDGTLVCSCLVLAAQADGSRGDDRRGAGRGERPAPRAGGVREAGAVQCGFCTPGLVVAAAALLDEHPVTERGRDQRGTVGQPVPLHRLREDLRRRPGRCDMTTVDMSGVRATRGTPAHHPLRA